MSINRREFLLFLGASFSTVALGSSGKNLSSVNPDKVYAADLGSHLSFVPIRGPMPLLTDQGATSTNQVELYSNYQIVDDLVLPEEFNYDIIARWGDRVGDSRFGYNNDYVSLVETAPNEGFLTVNFEYISAKPWLQTFAQVIGQKLPLAEVQNVLKASGDQSLNVFALPDADPTKQMIQQICQAALIDLGIGIISIRRNPQGKWERTYSPQDRRITGISGLKDGRYLTATGPSVAVFANKNSKGYQDNLGAQIIGSFNNCAGGTTPWGTVFSAEENYQDFVPEAVFPDGSAFDPSKRQFFIDDEQIGGLGNVFGLAGNKYGWMVEVDPANPNDFGTKHTWLGRYRHEAVGVRVETGKPLAFYSGCDRRGGHLYKFVSQRPVKNPQDKANSKLLTQGMLYVAKFNADGTGRWLALKPDTPINPDLPSVHAGGMINLPKRPEGGSVKMEKDEDIATFKQQFKTLGDLYEGSDLQKQGAILIDAHLAANAIGATCTARPEDTDIAPNGDLFITFTSGSPSGSDGGPDLRIFQGADGKAYEYGWIVRLREDGGEPGSLTFQWSILATGGEPADGGLGFANPDNLLIDQKGNLWVVTDMSSDKVNRAVPQRIEADGKPVSQSNLRGLYGNNSIWFIPTSGSNAGQAYLFGTGPMDAEMTGPYFSQDGKTLFLAVQHPGEIGGVRQDLASDTRQYAMKTTDGKEFIQTRQVPIGSNWPSKKANDPPIPSVIMIQRKDGGAIV